MIPQDCILVTRNISGKITDANGRPIKNAIVYVQNTFTAGFEAGKVNLILSTDTNGQFGYNAIPVFACDVLKFRVVAQGYTEKTVSYFAAAPYYEGAQNIDPDGYGKEIDYPNMKVTPSVLPRQVYVTLP